MKIGILALQGAFIEHHHMLRRLGADVIDVRLPGHLNDLDGLIIPGGESTTIGKLAATYGLMEPLREFARQKPTWGICAGMIFLANELAHNQQPILGVMDIMVDRNAFGRQVDSFEADLNVAGLEEAPFHAIFIRAPVATKAGDDVKILARLHDHRIVAARQKHLMATAFHPELTHDDRLHRYFMEIVAKKGQNSA